MTLRLHRDEVPTNSALVRHLLRSQMPDLAHLDLQQLPAQGTDNVEPANPPLNGG